MIFFAGITGASYHKNDFSAQIRYDGSSAKKPAFPQACLQAEKAQLLLREAENMR